LCVDDIIAGNTKADGAATISVPLGVHRLTAELLPDLRGVARNLDVAVSNNVPVDIVMESGADLSLAAELQLAEVADGVLPRDFSSASLQLVDDDGKTVRLRRIDTLSVHGFDDKGLSYRGAMQFAVGRFRFRRVGSHTSGLHERYAFLPVELLQRKSRRGSRPEEPKRHGPLSCRPDLSTVSSYT
jgi:hypothetical protein